MNVHLAGKSKFKNSSNIKKADFKWLFIIIGWTFILSVTMSLISDGIIPVVHIVIALFVLVAFILVGIFFDIIGIAVATGSETPFHSMASRRVKGSQQAIFLIRNAEKVSTFCNDVIGDIVGIVSGTTTAVIAMRITTAYGFEALFVTLGLTGCVAAVTVAGKGLGKTIALRNANQIVYEVALVMYYIDKLRRKEEA